MGKKGKKNEDKAKKEAKKARKQAKQEKAATKKENKIARAAGDNQINNIIEGFRKKGSAIKQVSVEDLEGPPSPRANASVTGLPNGEVLVFGGEYFDGRETYCFNDLYKLDFANREWKQIVCPNCPTPRLSHQAVLYRDEVYMFGGEFSTSDEFYHYKDFWKLDLKSFEWTQIDCRGSPPSARSGHRMVVWRNFLILFGGFYKALRKTEWFNDLYIYSFADMKWSKVTFPDYIPKPGPRSGFIMAAHPSNDKVFVYGGFAEIQGHGKKSHNKVYNDMWTLSLSICNNGAKASWEKVSKRGVRPSVRSGIASTVYKSRIIAFGGVVDHVMERHSDTYNLFLAQEGPSHDVESEFYDEIYSYDMDRRMWFKIDLKKQDGASGRRRTKARRGQTGSKTEMGDDAMEGNDDIEDESDEDGDDEGDEEENSNRFAFINDEGEVVYIDIDDEDALATAVAEIGGKMELEDEQGDDEDMALDVTQIQQESDSVTKLDERKEAKEQESSLDLTSNVRSMSLDDGDMQGADEEKAHVNENEGPRSSLVEEKKPDVSQITPKGRMCSYLWTKGNTLFIYGGLMEDGDKEITFDDCWSIDLNTRLSWICHFEGTMDEQAWIMEDEDEEDEYEDDDSVDDDEDEESLSGSELEEEEKERVGRKSMNVREEIEYLRDAFELGDENETPQVDESLRDFFARTSKYWVKLEIEKAAELESSIRIPLSEKELRRMAFSSSQNRYDSLKPVLGRLNELEREQQSVENSSAIRMRR